MDRLIYDCNRSSRLPRKKKREFKEMSSTVTQPYRAPDHREIPSVLERRCSKQWLTKEQDEDRELARKMLEEMEGED